MAKTSRPQWLIDYDKKQAGIPITPAPARRHKAPAWILGIIAAGIWIYTIIAIIWS